jgi:putative ABC transport system permease protein
MNLFVLVGSYLKARLMSTLMNIVLLALGITVIVFVLLVGRQLDEKASSNSKGIDLVVGAKGSPLQIILCSVYHLDFPTGNINLREAQRIAANRLVRKAIPLALGDSYKGFRIVGTDTSYANLYHAALADGKWWSADLEVVLGSNVASRSGLRHGDTFSSAHGLTTDGTDHDEHHYMVVGTLAPSGTVLDDLLLTNVASVWTVHGSPHAGDSTSEITSMLIKYRNPLAAIQLPRMINTMTSMQAASPAFEMSRLYTILGVGIDVLTGLAIVLISISALSTFLALYNALKDRRYDMAIMRAMGAGRQKLFLAMVMEGSALTLSGTALGIASAHVLLMILSTVNSELTVGISGAMFYVEELYLIAGALLLGVICSVVPALQASRVDIHEVLAGG